MKESKVKNRKNRPPESSIDKRSKRQPYRVHLPGFVSEEDLGLGDLIKRATYLIGIKPCDGCTHRAAKLNRLLVFSRKP